MLKENSGPKILCTLNIFPFYNSGLTGRFLEDILFFIGLIKISRLSRCKLNSKTYTVWKKTLSVGIFGMKTFSIHHPLVVMFLETDSQLPVTICFMPISGGC